MQIEDKWYDRTLYYVEFESEQGMKVKKSIILNSGLVKQEVALIIHNNFNNVKEIHHIDLWEDVLLLKGC